MHGDTHHGNARVKAGFWSQTILMGVPKYAIKLSIMALQISEAVAVFMGTATMNLENFTQNYKYVMKFVLRRRHMLYIHGNVCESRDIHVYDPSIQGSIKSFMMFKCLVYMTTNNIHSYMISTIRAIKFLL